MSLFTQLNATAWLLICIVLCLLALMVNSFFTRRVSGAQACAYDAPLMQRQTDTAGTGNCNQGRNCSCAPTSSLLAWVRAQASAAAHCDFRQPPGVLLTPNPYHGGSAEQQVWWSAYSRTMRMLIDIERAKS